MKVIVIYRPQSEHARVVEEFVHDISRQQNVEPQLVDVDSREGLATLSLYDIMAHPAVLVLRDDGQLIQHWSGDKLPLMHEVAAFVHG